MAKSPRGNGNSRPVTTARRAGRTDARELPKITTKSDTRDVLAHVGRDPRLKDYFIVDVDAHVTEFAF